MDLGEVLKTDGWKARLNAVKPGSEAKTMAVATLRKAMDGDTSSVEEMVDGAIDGLWSLGLEFDSWLREGLMYEVLMAALCTTYGVGELSAINGVAGSYAENLPIFWLVDMPASRAQAARRLVHHTLGNGEFDLFYKMVEPVVCARAIVTAENCAAETERLIATALYHRRPVYMAFPTDYATAPIVGAAQPLPEPKSDRHALEAAVKAVVAALDLAKTACIVPGMLVSRIGLTAQATNLVKKLNLPFATMFADKSVLDESLPNYIGMYDGKLMNEEIRAFVEGCDLVFGIGAVLTDFNSGSFNARIDRSKSVNSAGLDFVVQRFRQAVDNRTEERPGGIEIPVWTKVAPEGDTEEVPVFAQERR
jgi:TPP-dependent 2-oxoacid decarboxylase